MREPGVICLGAMVYDRVLTVKELPLRPIKVRATDWRERCGGPAATAAVAVASLGTQVKLWARVGTDTEGVEALATLRRHGVDTSGMMQIDGASTAKSVILIDAAGERLIAGYQVRGAEGAAERLRLDEVRHAGAVLADDSWRDGTTALFREARRCGVVSVLDGDIGTSDPAVLRELTGLSDHAVYADIGWKLLTGLDEPNEEVMRRLARELGTVIGVTQGAGGSFWMLEGRLHHVPALPSPVVDTTGAGDVFHGAYAAALAQGRPVLEAAAYASAAAAVKVRLGNGWAGMPTPASVTALLAETANDRPHSQSA